MDLGSRFATSVCSAGGQALMDERPPETGEPLRGPAKVEISRAMIEVGSDRVWELRGFDPNYIAEEIFRIMLAKSAEEQNRGVTGPTGPMCSGAVGKEGPRPDDSVQVQHIPKEQTVPVWLYGRTVWFKWDGKHWVDMTICDDETG
jgi:hypothetical protein